MVPKGATFALQVYSSLVSYSRKLYPENCTISIPIAADIIARSALLFVDALIWISVLLLRFVRRFSDFYEGDMRVGHMLSSLGLLTH